MTLEEIFQEVLKMAVDTDQDFVVLQAPSRGEITNLEQRLQVQLPENVGVIINAKGLNVHVYLYQLPSPPL